MFHPLVTDKVFDARTLNGYTMYIHILLCHFAGSKKKRKGGIVCAKHPSRYGATVWR